MMSVDGPESLREMCSNEGAGGSEMVAVLMLAL